MNVLRIICFAAVVYGVMSPVGVSAEVFYSDDEGEVVSHYVLTSRTQT